MVKHLYHDRSPFLILWWSIRASVFAAGATFIDAEGVAIDRFRAAGEALEKRKTSVMTLGFSEAEDKITHGGELIGFVGIANGSRMVGQGIGEGDTDRILRGVAEVAGGVGQFAGVFAGGVKVRPGALRLDVLKPKISQVRALRDLGVDRASRRLFFEGRPVGFEQFNPTGNATIGMVRMSGGRLQSGIVSVSDSTKAGHKAFFRFRSKSFKLGRSLAVDEMELFGTLVVNQEIVALLTRQGFKMKTTRLPANAGGHKVSILSKVFTLKGGK